MSSRCAKGKEEENREALFPSLRVKFPFHQSFARINKGRLGTSLGGYRNLLQLHIAVHGKDYFSSSTVCFHFFRDFRTLTQKQKPWGFFK